MGNRVTHIKLSESDTISPGRPSAGSTSQSDAIPTPGAQANNVVLLRLARRVLSSELGVEELRKMLEQLNRDVQEMCADRAERLQFQLVDVGHMTGVMKRSHPTAASAGSGSVALRKYRVDCLVVDSVTGSMNAQFRFTARQFGRLLERFAAALALDAQVTNDTQDTGMSNTSTLRDSGHQQTTPFIKPAAPATNLCSVCKRERADLVLSCQHALCSDCMTNWMTNKSVSSESDKCPQCSGQLLLPAGASASQRRASSGAVLMGASGAFAHRGRNRIPGTEAADQLCELPRRFMLELLEKKKFKKNKKKRSGGEHGVEVLGADTEADAGSGSSTVDKLFQGTASSNQRAESALAALAKRAGLNVGGARGDTQRLLLECDSDDSDADE